MKAKISLSGTLAGLALSLVIAGALPRTYSAQNKKPFTIDDIMKLKTVVDVRISPDGSRILYVITEPNLKESNYNSDIWLVASRGGTPVKLTNGPKRDDTPRWSPDGKRIAFISDRDGKPQIWLIDIEGGEASEVTEVKTGVAGFEWSPVGQKIAMIVPDGPTDEETKKIKEHDDVRVVDQDYKWTHVYLLDVAAKQTKQLTSGNQTVDDFCWSPDGKQIAYSTQPTPRIRDRNNTDISVIAVEGGQIRKLVERNGADSSPQWSPDGNELAFNSSNGVTGFNAQTFLCLVPSTGGTPRVISKSFDDGIQSFDWAADGKGLYFTAGRGVTQQLFYISKSGEVKAISSGEQVFGGFSFSKDSTQMAFLAQSATSAAEVYLSPTSRFEPAKLTNTNPQLGELAFGATEVIRWKSNDGSDIEGLLIKPVGFAAGKKYPLLTYVHGGPAGAFKLSFTPQLASAPIPVQAEPYPIQVFAAQGYAVLCPNPRGSTGYGEKFRMANFKDWGHGDYQDIMSGIDYLVKQGIADPDKLGIMGWSYGGYMTSWVNSQTNRFKAASVGAGITNVHSFYGQTDIPVALEAYFGGKPWSDLETYKKSSAMFFATNVKTPTLIQHGEKDDRVPIPQAQELYIMLKETGVPVEFAIYPRQGHLIMEPKLQLDMLTRNLNWFNRWVKGINP